MKDGLRAIMAKEKWRKAQLRLGIIRSLGGKKALQSLSDDAPAAEEKAE